MTTTTNSETETATPRTDAEVSTHPWTKTQISTTFARQLERELALSEAANAGLQESLRVSTASLLERQAQLAKYFRRVRSLEDALQEYAKRCPNCAGKGWYAFGGSMADAPEQVQCEWCDTALQALATATPEQPEKGLREGTVCQTCKQPADIGEEFDDEPYVWCQNPNCSEYHVANYVAYRAQTQGKVEAAKAAEDAGWTVIKEGFGALEYGWPAGVPCHEPPQRITKSITTPDATTKPAPTKEGRP